MPTRIRAFTSEDNMEANWVAEAFAKIGGDAAEVRRDASKYANLNAWLRSQTDHAAVAGAAAGGIPIAHLVTGAVDVGFLLNKMARSAYGAAAFYRITPTPDADLQAILAIWSGQLTEDMIRQAEEAGKLIAGAAGITAFGYVVVAVGALPYVASRSAAEVVKLIANDIGVPFNTLASIATSGVAYGITHKLIAKYGTKLNIKLAAKLAAKLAKFVVSKYASAFVPLLGAAAGAGINIWILGNFNESVRKYYEMKQRVENSR